MTKEDIIRMARESGAWPELSATPEKDVAFLERFAALVADAEREACAKRLEAVGCDHCAENIRARKETK